MYLFLVLSSRENIVYREKYTVAYWDDALAVWDVRRWYFTAVTKIS